MPALDPFSASIKGFRDIDAEPSNPLRFADTFHPRDPNSPERAERADTGDLQPLKLSAGARLPRVKKNHGLPHAFPEPAYSTKPAHSRQASYASVNEGIAGLNLGGVGGRRPEDVVGSDAWMTAQVAACMDAAKGELWIQKQNLTSLSTKIAELRDLVTLPSSFSPSASTASASKQPRPTVVPQPPLNFDANSAHLSPGTAGHYSGNGRSFGRIASAPASAAAFQAFNAAGPSVRPPHRYPGLAASPHLLASPTLTETSEEAQDGPRVANPPRPSHAALQASPSLAAPHTRPFARSKTGAANLSPAAPGPRIRDLHIYAHSNLLTSLPTALFDISNLTVLSLRGNKLTRLPAAIGALKNLKELNIGQNEITYLPSTILELAFLETFNAHPNKYLQPPSTAPPTPAQENIQTTSTISEEDEQAVVVTTTTTTKLTSDRRLGPLVRHAAEPVPRLSDICLNWLISPRGAPDLPPLLDYDWQVERGQPHPLLDAATLQRQHFPHIATGDLERMLQAVRSASAAATTTKDPLRFNPFPRSHHAPAPDDASTNPYFCPCPSPRHLEFDASSALSSERPSRHLFLHPAEERIEWREVCQKRDLPIQWLGCSPGCLAFLEEDEDEWGLDDFDDE